MVPQSLRQPLRDQMLQSRALWTADRTASVPGTWLPDALTGKFPRAFKLFLPIVHTDDYA